jgi:hypothetical protein
MADTSQRIMCDALLQGGVSCALATLHAIDAAGLFDALPSEPADRDRHEHGVTLLHMLGDQLRRIQQQVNELGKAPAAEGR